MLLNQRSISRNTMMLLTAIAIAGAAATGASASGPGGGGAGAGESRGGGFGGPFLDSAPVMPPPTFNPSTPYTVPQPRETPVSPASPGSVFGNG
jgi:hypothetical protein